MTATRLGIACLCFSLWTYGQPLNTEIVKEGQPPYLLGKINRSGLEGPHYYHWFQKQYQDYQPSLSVLDALKATLQDYEILVFMGTWCGDSQREVPRLLKILDRARFPMSQLRMVALSREPDLYKQSPEHEEKGLNIHRVPTVIIYKNGKEQNRIVESPVVSLEQDLLSISSKDPYDPRYALVKAVANKLQKGLKKLKRAEAKLLKTYKGKVSSLYELNTYAKMLISNGKNEEALAVLELNTKFFPEDAKAYISLSQHLLRQNRKKESIRALETALKLAPEDQVLNAHLNQLKSQ